MPAPIIGKYSSLYAHPDAFGIGAEMFLDKADIAERGGHQDIRLRAAANQIPLNLRARAHHVLRWSGFMVHIERIEIRALMK